MARTLRGDVRPLMAAAFPPFAVEHHPAGDERDCRCGRCATRPTRVRGRPGVLSVSPVLGFPYADVPEMGAAVIVVTDGDRPAAERHAAELARFWWDRRRTSSTPRPRRRPRSSPQAAGLDGPVCILDTGDNVGGGSPADGTVLAHELVRQKVGPAFVCLYDPESEAAARTAGVGSTVRPPGRRQDRRPARRPPVEGEFVVRRFSDGRFTESEARHGGMSDFDQGPTAVVESH